MLQIFKLSIVAGRAREPNLQLLSISSFKKPHLAFEHLSNSARQSCLTSAEIRGPAGAAAGPSREPLLNIKAGHGQLAGPGPQSHCQ